MGSTRHAPPGEWMIPRIRPFFDPSFIDAVLKNNPGGERKDYAKRVADRVKGHYIGAKDMEFLDYGNSSLLASFSILGLRKGDSIALPAFTCPTILGPVLAYGLRPVLIDVDKDMQMMPHMREQVDINVKALLVSHIFGIPMNLPAARELADERGIPLIEDCAHSVCSTVDGQRLGTIGDVSFTSFRVDKPLSIGKGSVLALNNPEYAERFREVVDGYDLNSKFDERMSILNLMMYFIATERTRYSRFLGIEEFYQHFLKHPDVGEAFWNRLKEFPDMELPKVVTHLHPWYDFFRGKFVGERLGYERIPVRMNKLSLKLLWKALEFADDANASRIAVCNRYIEEMGEDGNAVTPSNLKGVPLLRFPIICHDARDHRRLKKALTDVGVEAGIFNWSPSIGQALGRRGECPSADHIASNILNLPSHPYVTDEEVKRIVTTIRSVCG